MPAERSPLPALRRAGFFLLLAASLSVGVHAASAATRTASADPNALGKGAADAVSVVTWVAPGVYQLDVQNTSGIGFINQFVWTPPANLTITGVKSTEGGRCSLVGGNIQCNGKVKPPDCTCEAGGDLTVTFTANGLEPKMIDGVTYWYGLVGAYLQITQMTPVPYHIPSSVPTKPALDLPLCKKGQKSTKLHPCL